MPHMRRLWTALAVAGVSIAAGVAFALASPGSSTAAASTCVLLPNGQIKHVINIVFDNVHFSRDNPNVPSDLEQMPHLLNFLKSNGTVFSNSHTPMIAHTADDSLTIYTGLYGDRHGQPLTNSYKTYNPDGSTDPATSFTYWTSPIIDTKTNPPVAEHDRHGALDGLLGPRPGDGGDTGKITPGAVGAVHPCGLHGRRLLDGEHGARERGRRRPDGVRRRLGRGDGDRREPGHVQGRPGRRVRRRGDPLRPGRRDLLVAAQGRGDKLPTEPGGYNGYQALFGAKYIAPAIGGGPNVFHNGYRVTDANGNLVDLDGHTLTEPFTHTPGFPGFSPTAKQTLAVMADMQEAGIPVTYGYISDLHERKVGHERLHDARQRRPSAGGRSARATPATSTNAQHYDAAFATFFQRLAADGITPENTLFVISAEENDQFAGANVGRATAADARPAATASPCLQLPDGQIGELQANIKGLLSGPRRAPARSSTSSRRARRSTSTATRPRTTRRSASSSVTRRR